MSFWRKPTICPRWRKPRNSLAAGGPAYLVIALVTALSCLPSSAYAQQLDPRFSATVDLPGYEFAMISAALLQQGLLGRGCFQGNIDARIRSYHPLDLQFAEGRVWPVSGTWDANIAYKRCGEFFRTNIAVIAQPEGAPFLVTTVPGESEISYPLKQSLRDDVIAFASRIMHREDCEIAQITNSRITQRLSSLTGVSIPKGPFKHLTWTESWTVRACGRETDIHIDLKIDPDTDELTSDLRVNIDLSTGAASREVSLSHPIYIDDGQLQELFDTAVSGDHEQVQDARKDLRYLANENIAEAQYLLASALAKDPEHNRSFHLEGLYWAARATANGSAAAARLAGWYMEMGPFKAPPDLRAAALMYRRSAALGSLDGTQDFERLTSTYPWLVAVLEDHPAF